MAMASSTLHPSSTSPTTASPFALTTTYIPPTQCAQSVGGLTMLQNKAYEIWLNDPEPVPGTTVTSCYPSQFMSSYLLEKGGQSQAAFSPLVCPEGYTTQGPFTSNYIACCPSGWNGLAINQNAPSNRPALGGTCYTNIYNIPIQITQYDDSSILASSIFTATDTSAQAYAIPWEGFAFGVANLASLTHTASSTFATTVSSSQASSSVIPGSLQLVRHHGLPRSALIATIVSSVLAGLLLISLLVLFLRYRRHRRIPSDSYHSSNMFGKSPTDSPSSSISPESSNAGSEPPTPALARAHAVPELGGRSKPQEMHVVERPVELDGRSVRRSRERSEEKTVLRRETERERENEKFRFWRIGEIPRIVVSRVEER